MTQYLSYTLNDPSWGNFMSFTSTFSLSTCAWSYDSAAKTLSTGCGPTVFYLGNNFTEAVLTTDVAAARKDVVVGASSIFLGTYQALTPSNNSRKSINVYSCLSPKAMLNITPVSTPPPPSVDSGNYNIKFNGKCLFINGAGQVVLDTCPNVPTVWRYNKTDQTLSVGNQCLTNNSAGCAALQNLVMGPCGAANTKRFVLGTNNKIYDPLLGMCYTPTSPVMQIRNHGLRHVRAEKSTTYWIILGVSASVVLLLVSLGLVYIFRQGYVKGSVTVTS